MPVLIVLAIVLPILAGNHAHKQEHKELAQCEAKYSHTYCRRD